MTITGSILLSSAATIGGFFLRLAYEFVRDKRRFKKELRDNNHIDVSGTDWHAAWQTSVEIWWSAYRRVNCVWFRLRISSRHVERLSAAYKIPGRNKSG